MTIKKTEQEWRDALSPAQYRVLRQHGTEPAGSSPLNHEKRAGEFLCAGCGAALYDSATKYESGSGWPSFYQAKTGAVATNTDASHGMVRDEVVCGQLRRPFWGTSFRTDRARPACAIA